MTPDEVIQWSMAINMIAIVSLPLLLLAGAAFWIVRDIWEDRDDD